MKEHLCYAKNKIEITYDSVGSHAATHFEDTPPLKPAVIEALKNVDAAGEKMFFEHDLDRVIGTTDLVETSERDEIIFAKRKNRETFTRFTKSQTPQACSTITIFLEKLPDDTYNLGSAWVGHTGPSFPGGENETPASKPYWSKHALVWGRQEVQEGTETAQCPW